MTKEKTLTDKIIFIDSLLASTFSKKTRLYYCDVIDEIERLNNIIKEVREYIEKEKVLPLGEQIDKLLEILDKGDKHD